MRSLRRQVAVGMEWVKGRARFDGGAIVLDPATLTKYQPLAVSSLPYELVGVNEPREAVEFARRFGLLRHGPDAEEHREPWTEWSEAAGRVKAILNLYIMLGNALTGDRSAAASIRTLMRGHFKENAKNDGEALAQASVTIQELVAGGLEDVQLGFQADYGLTLPDGSKGQPGGFAMSARSPDLLGLIYYGLALALSMSVPARACEGCGRIFPVSDPRQRYHDSRCAQRARYRRWADKKGGGKA